MRKLIATSILCLCTLFLFAGTAHAQQIDAAFGVNTLTAPSASSASGNHSFQSLTGGAYPVFSADVLFYHQLGLGGEVAWRASQNYYQGFASIPYRPVFFDFNAVYAPSLGDSLQPELQAGIGAEAIRFYGYYNPYTGTNYATSKHFMGHFGFGLKYYMFGNFFIRPEVHFYLVNNNVEFSSAHATRFGISIGYTLGSH